MRSCPTNRWKRRSATARARSHGAAAIRRARALASDKAYAGAGAFSRSGDPSLGEFEDAVILKSFGEVPEDFAAREYELLGIALTRKQSCQRELQGLTTA